MKAAAIRAIVRKALATIGAVSRPQKIVHSSWDLHPQEELDLDVSLESDPLLMQLTVEKKETKRTEVIVCIDTSLSMTGKKLALTAVALAVIALQIDPEDLAVIAFETEANLIKGLGEKKNVYEILKAFLDVPARGLTNIESGLLQAAVESAKGKLKRKSVILMSDGRFTAGRNPEYVVPRLPRLHIVQTGSPWASPRFCRSLATLGHGRHLRVGKTEHLPKALYSLVHELIR